MLGSALRVSLPPGLAPGARLRLGVRFTTSPTSSAVQFLEPQQTAGGQHPYLFTQCQAIHARSLVPCQVGKPQLLLTARRGTRASSQSGIRTRTRWCRASG